MLGPNLYAPKFANVSYAATFGEYLALNSLLFAVNATDKDSGRNGLVKYQIQPWGDDYKYFSIDSSKAFAIA